MIMDRKMTLSAGEPSCSKEEDTGNERESFKGEDISYLAVLRGIQTPCFGSLDTEKWSGP